MRSVVQIDYEHPQKGDILVFLPGQEDIENCKDLIKSKLETVEVLCLFAALPHYEQMKVFKPSDKRKVILSTNIAETSLTIPNVDFVVDTGKVKVKESVTVSGIERLRSVNVSQNSATQV